MTTYEIGHYVLVTHPDSLMTPNQPCEVVKILKSGEYVVAQDGYAETWAGEWLQPENTWGIRAGYVAPPEHDDHAMDALPYMLAHVKPPRPYDHLIIGVAKLSAFYAEIEEFLSQYDFTIYDDDSESEPDND